MTPQKQTHSLKVKKNNKKIKQTPRELIILYYGFGVGIHRAGMTPEEQNQEESELILTSPNSLSIFYSSFSLKKLSVWATFHPYRSFSPLYLT